MLLVPQYSHIIQDKVKFQVQIVLSRSSPEWNKKNSIYSPVKQFTESTKPLSTIYISQSKTVSVTQYMKTDLDWVDFPFF